MSSILEYLAGDGDFGDAVDAELSTKSVLAGEGKLYYCI